MPINTIGSSECKSAFFSIREKIKEQEETIQQLQAQVLSLKLNTQEQSARMKQSQGSLSMLENQNRVLKGLIVASIAITLLALRR
ncbi:hypothetical protein EB008_03230 [bacterium]|nr:hypothetical protein [bacterium]